MSVGKTSLLNMESNLSFKKRKVSKNYLRNRANNKESLKTCGILLIQHTVEKVLTNSDILGVYMDEMLHSIFFLGYIHKDRLTPKDFFSPTFHEVMSNLFPEPFTKYKSHLPTRTPFSILLNMVEILCSTEEIKETIKDEKIEEEIIKEELQRLLKDMKFPNPLHKPGSKNEEYYTLESTVICVCSDSDSQKYYGASLCCRKGAAKEILIGLSCLKTWHEYVSHAVMSFSSGASGDDITFPDSLRCQAFQRDWSENVYKEKQPCSNCKQLFNLQNADENKVEHPFGNCAETECLSKLLINNQYMHKNVVFNKKNEKKKKKNLDELRSSTKENLIQQLETVGIHFNDATLLFYEPSHIRIVPGIDVGALISIFNHLISVCPAHG